MITFNDAEDWRILNKEELDGPDERIVVFDLIGEPDIGSVRKTMSLRLLEERSEVGGEPSSIVDPAADFDRYFADFISNNRGKSLIFHVCFSDLQRLNFGIEYDYFLVSLYRGLLFSIHQAVLDNLEDVSEQIWNVHVWIYLI